MSCIYEERLMLSKKRWRIGLAFLSLLICLGFLLTRTPLDNKPHDPPLSDADPTRHFTAEVIAEYLDETYGDKADQMWEAWGSDKGWATMITNARSKDTFALIAPDGSVSWYYFDGNSYELNGIHEVTGPQGFYSSGFRPISRDALEEVRGNYALIGGLFRESDNTMTLSWYPKGVQEGKHGYSGSISEIDVHTMRPEEYYPWKFGPSLSGAGVGGVIGWIIAGPPGAVIGSSIGAIAFAFIGSSIDGTLPARPVYSLIIDFTVYLSGPNQTQTYDNQPYHIVWVGRPLNQKGYDWSYGTREPFTDWISSFFFSNLYILNTYVFIYILLNFILYISIKIQSWCARLMEKAIS